MAVVESESWRGKAGEAPPGDPTTPFWLRPIIRTDSLRAQLLSGLSVLLFIALLAIASALLIWLPEEPSPPALIAGLVVIVAVDVAVLVVFGDYLLRHQFVKPLARMVDEAEAIAAGDHDRRLEEAGSRELRRLASSVNRMADRLIRNQELLAENIRSLDETNRALTEARSELVQAEKLASVGRLAAGVAHEIGSPLGAILGYVEMMKRRGGAAPEWLEEIREEADKVDELVRGLLDYARPKKASIRTIAVNELVERAVRLLEVQGRLKGVTVETGLKAPSPRVRADAHQLEQVLVNLLLNARDAIESAGGSGTIGIRTSEERFERFELPDLRQPARRGDDPRGVDFRHLRRFGHGAPSLPAPRFRAGDPVVRIVVTDDGVGLPGEEVARIFDPFYTTKEPGRGTGLGLAVSGRLVAGMGGTIEVFPRDGGGARFAVVLPAAGAADPPDAGAGGEEDEGGAATPPGAGEGEAGGAGARPAPGGEDA